MSRREKRKIDKDESPKSSKSSSSLSSSERASKSKGEDEIDNKQVGYENQIERLEDRIKKLKGSVNIDYNLLWATTRECAQLYNKLGEYQLKGDSPVGCEDFFEKAAKLVENHPNKELQKTSEWKALKISIYRNFSQYYSKIGNHEKALNALKHILPQQKELEDMNIILPGVEFLYINMADLAFKLKNYNESFRFAEMASNLLEKQLNISNEEILAMKTASLQQKSRVAEDPKAQMTRSRKFIALSYCLYLAGKSLVKGKDLIYIQQAVPVLEKAYIISSQYMGNDDKITKSYKKKFESAVALVEQSEGIDVISPEIVIRRTDFVPPYKLHTKTKSLVLSPRHTSAELSARYPAQENKKFLITEEKPSTLPTDRGSQKNNALKGPAKRAKNLSAQWTTDFNQNHLPSPVIVVPYKGVQRNASQGTLPSNYNSKRSEFTIENNDLMIFEGNQTPFVKKMSQAANMGELQTRQMQTHHTSMLRTESAHQIPRFPDNFSKLIAADSTTLREPLTASTSIHTNSNRIFIHKKSASGSFRPSTAVTSHQRSSADLLDTATYRSTSNHVPRLGLNSASTSKSLRSAMSKEGPTTALIFITDRPMTGNSKKTKISSGISTFSGKMTRPGTAIQKSDRGSLHNQQEPTELQFTQGVVKREGSKQRPISAAIPMSNRFAVKGIHPEHNLTPQIKYLNSDNNHQSEMMEDPPLGQASPISLSASRGASKRLSPYDEDHNYGALTERRYQGGLPEVNLTTSQTEELEQLLELDHHLQKGLRGSAPGSEFNEGKSNFTPVISENYINNIKGPRKNLSKELVTYLKVTAKQDSKSHPEGFGAKTSMSPGLREQPESPKDFFPQYTAEETTENQSSPIADERGITVGNSMQRVRSERPTLAPGRFKVARDLNEFRRMEEEAARKIQAYIRQRKARKQAYDGDENSIEMHSPNSGAFTNLMKGVMEMVRAVNEEKSNSPQPFAGRSSIPVNPSSSVFDRENLEYQGAGHKKLANIPDEEYIRNKFSDSFQIETKKDGSLNVDDEQISTISVKPINIEAPKSEHQPHLLTLYSPNAFLGDFGLKPSSSPVKNINLSPKAEIIQKNVTKLHKLEVKFAKQIQGFASYWTLKVSNINEAEGNLLIDSVLSNERVSFQMQTKIDFKTAERSMFQFSVWPLVAESKGFEGTGQETFLRRSGLIGRRAEGELFENPIVVLGLKSEKERKKMGAGEEISIRKLLAMLTQHVKQKTARYRKKTGYVFASSKMDHELDIIRRNREELETYKQKYAEAIKKLSTFFAFHSIVHERKNSIIKETIIRPADLMNRSSHKRRDGRSHKVINAQTKPSSIEIDEEDSSTSIKLAPASKGSHTVIEEEEPKLESVFERKSAKGGTTQKTISKSKRNDKKRTNTITDLASISGQSRRVRAISTSKQVLPDSPYDVTPSRVIQFEKSHNQIDKTATSFMGVLTKEIESYKNPFIQSTEFSF